eukprot:1734863-Pleurochrysis_carterae.AAC.5
MVYVRWTWYLPKRTVKCPTIADLLLQHTLIIGSAVRGPPICPLIAASPTSEKNRKGSQSAHVLQNPNEVGAMTPRSPESRIIKKIPSRSTTLV